MTCLLEESANQEFEYNKGGSESSRDYIVGGLVADLCGKAALLKTCLSEKKALMKPSV